MKETGNILGWLGVAEEHSIILDVEKHIEETCQTVALLAEGVKALLAGDLAARTIAIVKVKESERAADKLRTKIIDQLVDVLLLPRNREDLMRFAKAVDKIADCTNRAARLMGLLDQRLPDNVLGNVAISTQLIVSSVSKLHEAIDAMGKKDSHRAMEACNEVDRLEHQADDQKRLLLDAILHAGLDAPTLLVAYNLAEVLEGITDRIDTAADMIQLLVVKAG